MVLDIFLHNNLIKKQKMFYLKAKKLKIKRRLNDSNILSMEKDGLRASAYHNELR